MLQIGIDQFTIILLPSDSLLTATDYQWSDIAQQIIYEFEIKAKIYEIFGERKLVEKGVSGYEIVYSYGKHDFSFKVGYHPKIKSMGVLVFFSAKSLAFYQEKANVRPYEILKNICSSIYKVRCSRIDIAVDYINEEINLNEINNKYNNNELAIYVLKAGKLIKREYTIGGITKENHYETIEFGSRNSNVFLRIYDKKTEQIAKREIYYNLAKKYESWIRFEEELKRIYAHQLTEKLLEIKSDKEYANLLALAMIQKYTFQYLKDGKIFCMTEYSQQLLNCIENGNFQFKSLSTRNTELARSIIHIFKTSGVVSTLYKVLSIWGESGLDILLRKIKDYILKHKPNYDCKRFIDNNAKNYKTNYRDINSFIDEEIKGDI